MLGLAFLAKLAAVSAVSASWPQPCAEQTVVLRRAADEIEKTYLEASQARRIAEQVRAWAKSNRYASDCAKPAAFLEQLNVDLRAYDGHFLIERVERDAKQDDWLFAWRAGGPASNMGIREVRILEGNIGYIRLASFYPWDMTRTKLQAAWQLLGDADALVIDLRQNGGGDAATAEHIVRSALGPKAADVQRIERRAVHEPDAPPAADLEPIAPNVPIAVLVDRRAASASEYVAYSLQAAKRAIVVGSRSAGAASLLGEPIPLGNGYQISVPSARPVNLVTGGNWDRAGVRPDVAGGDDPIFVARNELARLRAAGASRSAGSN
ncbi:MAG TPA: S41 family peptidase [Sphingomicrobium sp.]